MAQPKVNVDWKVRDALLQFKVTLNYCSDYLGVSNDTIQRRCKEEKGMSFSEYHTLKLQRTAVKLQQRAIEMALTGNATMLIFSLKNIAGWSDKVDSEISVESSGLNITISKEDMNL